MKWFAGIGSTNIPTDIATRLYLTCFELNLKGYSLRSGGADGSDSVAETAYDCFMDNQLLRKDIKKEIFLPWKGFNGNTSNLIPSKWDNYEEILKLAEKYHPNFKNLTLEGKALIARNGCQILGRNLDDPVDFVLCYTSNGTAKGGTGQGVRIANYLGIPVYNLYYDGIEKFIHFLP